MGAGAGASERGDMDEARPVFEVSPRPEVNPGADLGPGFESSGRLVGKCEDESMSDGRVFVFGRLTVTGGDDCINSSDLT